MLRSSNAVYYGLVVLLLCLWAGYFVSPIDLLPDGILGFGWIDDLGALAGLYWYLHRLGRPRGSHAAHGNFRSKPHGAETTADTPSDADSVAAEDPWQVLHIAPGASPAQIHAAYKAQMLQYHPDRVAHLGEDLQRLAHCKTQAINRAYARLTQQQEY